MLEKGWKMCCQLGASPPPQCDPRAGTLWGTRGSGQL